MTTNVPQDVLEDALTSGIYKEVYANGTVLLGNDIPKALSKFAQLRAQRQQGAEPVAWKDIDLDGMAEAFSRVIDAHHSKANPFHGTIDKDAKVALRILRGIIPAMKYYTTPPQANALVAAFGRKAAEIALSHKAEEYPELAYTIYEEILAAIPKE
jgi:hypothetical protein